MAIKSEDYEERACPLCMGDDAKKHIPISRVIEKLDEELSRNDYAAGERILDYWLSEARLYDDLRGVFAVRSEQMGLYRKVGNREKGYAAAEEALSLIPTLGLDDTVTAATAYINAATVYKSFKDAASALPLYEKARVIYEKRLEADDARLGGLYNNMALALVDMERFDEADALYRKAMDVMSKNEYGELEMAITCLNMADAATARYGIEESEKTVGDLIEKAAAYLNTDGIPRNGYYAFVCEKCAPTFGYYGYFLYEAEFSKRAEEIYERA